MSKDGPQFITGHCRVTYLPTVLLGRPVIVKADRKRTRKRWRRIGNTANPPPKRSLR
jgi:hypothetical protein